VVDGYKAPSIPPTDNDEKKFAENNSRTKNAIHNGDESIFTKIMH
jgi:hypothetical protein